MPGIVVVGAQWGDEGKGKIVDLLTPRFDAVVRYQGGHNAGHTVVVDNHKIVLHIFPSGVVSGKYTAIGNGVVIDLPAMNREKTELAAGGIVLSPENFAISGSAHVILPYHVDEEQSATSKRIDTTKRGIGPCYSDKAERTGIRIGDLANLHDSDTRDRVLHTIEQHYKVDTDALSRALGTRYRFGALENYLQQLYLGRLNKKFNVDPRKVLKDLEKEFESLKPFVVDTSLLVNDWIKKGWNVLFEGAQGTLLDVDHGTYPFVTSSNATAGGALTGTGVSPLDIEEVIIVAKAYTTRVGGGPFPTELGTEKEISGERRPDSAGRERLVRELFGKVINNTASEYEIGRYMRAIGDEYGATTGRPRRCGWGDTAILRNAARVNGGSGLHKKARFAITKADVLDSFADIQYSDTYSLDGEEISYLPRTFEEFSRCRPVYSSIRGWKQDTSRARSYSDLPQREKVYLREIEEKTGIPIGIISVGPDRSQTIFVS